MEVFQIPIEDFEEDMERKSAKEKKEEILELFTHNKLNSEEEFNKIKNFLHDACREGDIELIKILLSETIVISSEGYAFKIDETNQTASLFDVNNGLDELIIPRTVEHESIEYLITSIFFAGSSAKTIIFSEDSAVKTFYQNAFPSKLEEIYFPSSLKELKAGWCYFPKTLRNIIISPSNGQFKYNDDKYLIGKSDPNNSEFDTLLFVRRDIEQFSIPSNIKIISSNAFDFSDIKEIYIPPNVSKICESAFSCCVSLTKIEIPTNSNLQTIESFAFIDTKIKEIYFPASLNELKEGWCCETDYLRNIIISPSNGQFKYNDDKYLIGKSDPNNSEFDTLLFVRRDIEQFSISSNIKIISSCAFDRCFDLQKVEIPINSNLQIIESFAFSSSNIESIFIPSKVLKICEFAFEGCQKLQKVEISTNSNLQIIENNAFSYSGIFNIFIPSKVSKIYENAFSFCSNLRIIEISEESKLKSLRSSSFSNCPNLIIMIPSLVNIANA